MKQKQENGYVKTDWNHCEISNNLQLMNLQQTLVKHKLN